MWLRVVVFPLALALGCYEAPGKTRSELNGYLDRSRSWAPVEAETARIIERILATQFVDEAEVQRQIAESRPRLLAHLERMRAYHPGVPSVERIHARYTAAWQTLVTGFDVIEEGFASGDYTKLARGREAMLAWRRAILEVADDLRELRGSLEPTSTASKAR